MAFSLDLIIWLILFRFVLLGLIHRKHYKAVPTAPLSVWRRAFIDYAGNNHRTGAGVARDSDRGAAGQVDKPV